MSKKCCKGKCCKKDSLEKILRDHLDSEARIHTEIAGYAKERFRPVKGEFVRIHREEHYEGNLVRIVGDYLNQMSMATYFGLAALTDVMAKHLGDSKKIHQETYERLKRLYSGGPCSGGPCSGCPGGRYSGGGGS